MQANPRVGGLEPFPTPQSRISVIDLTQTSPMRSDSVRSGSPLATSTGSLFSTSRSPVAYRHSRRSSVAPDTGSPPAVLRRSTTVKRFVHNFYDVLIGSLPQLYPELDLNGEVNPCREVRLRIGTPSPIQLDVEGWSLSRQISTFVVTSSCAELNLTILRLLVSRDKFTSIGEPLELGSLGSLGLRPGWMHTQKILAVSFGMAIGDIKMLLSTSFVVESIFHICCDGWIDIRLLLKLKDPPQF